MAFLSSLLMLSLIVGSKFWSPGHFEIPKSLIAPPPHIEFFSFGFQPQLADSLWVRAIQDFDYCEEPLGKQLCKGKSWLYQMLDTITNLDPNYKMAYSRGALALTVVISDIEGASLFYDKAVKQYPYDWPLLYQAAYHALYEEKNKEKAANLMMRAGQNGAEPWVFSLATRLYTDAGKRELGLRVYNSIKDWDNIDEQIKKRMREKLGL